MIRILMKFYTNALCDDYIMRILENLFTKLTEPCLNAIICIYASGLEYDLKVR